MTLRSFVLGACASLALAAPAMAQMSPSTPANPSDMRAPTADLFYTDAWTPGHWRASEAIGMSVYNRAGERIGEIDDVIVDGAGRVMAAVVGVGGFLGIGERKVAVTFRSLEMTRESNGNARIVVDLTRPALQSAPEYRSAPARRS